MTPYHSIGPCPICGGGLCGIRICGLPTPNQVIGNADIDTTTGPHGLIVCDECEAIWLDPDKNVDHQYTDPEDPRCPICRDSLWNGNNHWANTAEVHFIGWSDAVDPNLDYHPGSIESSGTGVTDYPAGPDSELA